MYTKVEHVEEDFNYFDEVFRFANEEASDLIKAVEATRLYPAYFGGQQLKAISYKVKAEYGLFRHYYRDYAIPAAQAMSERLEKDYNSSTQKADNYTIANDYFQTPLKDAIYAGYVGINHKLESFVEFIKAHAKGKEYGPLGLPVLSPIPYDELLKSDYNLSFDDLLGSASFYPRIQRIRLIANRIKHQSGYPKSNIDPVIDHLTGQKVSFPLQIPLDFFLKDLVYGEVYLHQLICLISQAYHTALTAHIMTLPVEDGAEEYRKQIIERHQVYKKTLGDEVEIYRSLFIDSLAAVN